MLILSSREHFKAYLKDSCSPHPNKGQGTKTWIQSGDRGPRGSQEMGAQGFLGSPDLPGSPVSCIHPCFFIVGGGLRETQ
jgi:hypothetical protein